MTGNSRICPECGNQFTIGQGRGQAKTYCNVECTKRASRRRAKAARSSFPVCKVDGCVSRVRSARAEYCELHYMRVRRNGHVQLKLEVSPPKEEIDHSHGYILEYAPGHWHALRTGNSRVYQHRRVYFDEYGEGPFDCHWCGTCVTWDDMHVDHVNAVKDDNRLENLVASCAECNQKRGKEKMRNTARESVKGQGHLEWRDPDVRRVG